jgi:RNA polymerase sigma-70 factor (ECF subfamily)
MAVRDSGDGHALTHIAARIREGDAEALGELYDAVGQRAFALARRVLGDRDAAEDAVHEAFAQLWERAATLEPAGRIDSLVMTIVHRRAIDAVRRRRGVRMPLQETSPLVQIDERAEAALDEVVTAISEASLRARLRDILAALPEEQRLVVQGVYFESLTLREIAERREIPLGTVKSRLRLAMARLGAALRTEVQR